MPHASNGVVTASSHTLQQHCLAVSHHTPLLPYLPHPRPAVNWRLQMAGLSDDEPLTDMRMPLVASDLGHHLRQAAALGRPLYVTETGIADRHDVHRSTMIQQYYGQVGGWLGLAWLHAYPEHSLTAVRLSQLQAADHAQPLG